MLIYLAAVPAVPFLDFFLCGFFHALRNVHLERWQESVVFVMCLLVELVRKVSLKKLSDAISDKNEVDKPFFSSSISKVFAKAERGIGRKLSESMSLTPFASRYISFRPARMKSSGASAVTPLRCLRIN